MPTVADVLNALESIAPSRYAFEFDKIGLQVGDPSATVTKAVVSLDRSIGAANYAAAEGAQLLLSHHPLLFEPAKTVTSQTHVGRTVMALIRHNINFIAAHTNWDSAKGGVNDALAARLGLSNVRDFGSGSDVDQLKLTVYAPEDSIAPIIDAASAAGAGEIGLYSRCAFFGSGTGTFRGGEGSNPSVGQPGQVENVQEIRLEMVLPAERRYAVERAVRANHPYDEPALDFFVLTSTEEQPAGRIGSLGATSLGHFKEIVEQALGGPAWVWGDPQAVVEKVAVVGGAADGEWSAALRAGAHVFVTGEVRQHTALEAIESGLPIIAAGHYATEQPGVEDLVIRMRNALPEIEWLLFAPKAGASGRPF